MTHEKGLYVRAALIINTLLIFLSTVVYKLIVGEHCIAVATLILQLNRYLPTLIQ